MDLVPEFFPSIFGFEWDEGNSEKNWRRHRVTRAQAEQAFLNRPLLAAPSPGHSRNEDRYFALGQTDQERRLALVFVLRGALLRVISARPMSRRERRSYDQAKKAEGNPAV